MFKFICLVLCLVAVKLNGVYAGEDGPATMEDIFRIMEDCGKETGVTVEEQQSAMRAKDMKAVDPCVWGCILKKTGFIDEKGQYVLYPGLTNVNNIVKKHEEAFKLLENIAKECESVKNMKVTDGEAGCEMGALLATCFYEQYELALQKGPSSKR